jgi:two-component system, NarL family, response regulator DevR
MEERTRVMLVDDHAIVRDGVRMIVETAEDLVVVGEADSGPRAVDRAVQLRPDVVLMDVRLDGGNGIQAARDIRERRPSTKVVMLTAYDDDEALFASIRAGACGYLLKRVGADRLLGTIREVAAGRSSLDSEVTGRVLEGLRRSPDVGKDDKLARLTSREEEILRLLAEGKTNAQIAERVFLSELTVKNHVSSILSKLGVTRRTEAAAYQVRRTSRFD